MNISEHYYHYTQEYIKDKVSVLKFSNEMKVKIL